MNTRLLSCLSPHFTCELSVPPSPRHRFLIRTLQTASKEGYLTKLGGVRKNWKERWFVLVRHELKYYAEKGKTECIKSLDLTCCEGVDYASDVGKNHCFA